MPVAPRGRRFSSFSLSAFQNFQEVVDDRSHLGGSRKTDRRVVAENGNWQSVRLSLKEDGMGHSFNITTIFKGTKTHIKYANHWESVYVLSGKGKIEMVDSGDVYELTPGTIYLLDQHDEHYLYGGENEDMVVACAFTPPLSGKEVHDENGVYPADLD
ncbi:ectoine synthase [Alcanivorax sp. IO_7]|nr:ectoine synthase [Alcanivorax sp. IO_7]